MPYVAIKARPRDKELIQKMVEKINQDMIEVWNCPQHAINISVEQITADDWEEQVTNKLINPHLDQMMILNGEKKY